MQVIALLVVHLDLEVLEGRTGRPGLEGGAVAQGLHPVEQDRVDQARGVAEGRQVGRGRSGDEFGCEFLPLGDLLLSGREAPALFGEKHKIRGSGLAPRSTSRKPLASCA